MRAVASSSLVDLNLMIQTHQGDEVEEDEEDEGEGEGQGDHNDLSSAWEMLEVARNLFIKVRSPLSTH